MSRTSTASGGLTYWSHRLSTWADLWKPEGNAQPEYDLAWQAFEARQTTEFITWQADMVREYARPGQFVTTCLAYGSPGLEDDELTDSLDVTAGNPYGAVPDHGDQRPGHRRHIRQPARLSTGSGGRPRGRSSRAEPG
jgi:beta-galactosidase GanA